MNLFEMLSTGGPIRASYPEGNVQTPRGHARHGRQTLDTSPVTPAMASAILTREKRQVTLCFT